MCNDIIDGISIILNSMPGGRYTVYSENVEQNLSLPCFFINYDNMIRKKMIGERYLVKYSFDIHYFPKNNNDKADMLKIAELLFGVLKLVKLGNGDLISGKNMKYSIINNILHFFVDFNVVLMEEKSCDVMDSMENIDFSLNVN